jgi:anti-sigma-K factor RskA
VDIKELIESGSLELYVMGALPAAEATEIDALRKVHPEVNDEINRIEDTMINYANSHAIKPTPELKEKIAKKLNFSINLDLDQERVDSISIQMPGIYRFAAAAAIALIVVFGGTAGYFFEKFHNAETQLAALQNEKTQLADQVKLLSGQSDKLKTELAVASNPQSQKVLLNGLPISPGSKAIIYWDKNSGNTWLKPVDMPAIAANEQFQLWAIVNGKPVDLGVIAKDTDSTFFQMKQVENATAFAITLEPLGGKPTPTLDKMYVMGTV